MSRTVDGLVTVNADEVNTIDLQVTGTATIAELEIGDIVVDSLQVTGDTLLNTLEVSGLAELDGGATTTTLTATTANITNFNLTTPLAPSQGGTGQTDLAAVTVGKASDVDGGQTGQVLVQVNVGDTGYVGSADVGSVLTCNGALVLPSFQYPSVSNVTGVLPVLNGGTGVTTATGTGSVVLNSGPTLVAPYCDILVATGTSDSTSNLTGAVIAPSGGISCGKNMFSGAKVLAQSVEESTDTDTGGIQTLGGIAAKKNIYTGGKVVAQSVEESADTDTGAIQTLGGIAAKKNINAGGKVIALNTDDVSVVNTGAIQSRGGISAVKTIFSSLMIRSTQNIASPQYLLSRSGVDRVAINADNTGGNRLIINPDLDYNSVLVRNLSLNNLPFTYLRGAFTPLMTTLKLDASNTFWTIDPWNSPTINFSLGYYSRIADQVNISITTSVSFSGVGNDLTSANRLPIITNLPIRAGIPGGVMSAKNPVFNCVATNVSYPNGRTVGGVPAVTVPVYDDPYTAVLCPNGYGYDPIPIAGNPAYPPFTLDGKTLVFETVAKAYAPDPITIPPYNEIYSLNQTLDNLHILDTGSYTLTFYINMTYITDE